MMRAFLAVVVCVSVAIAWQALEAAPAKTDVPWSFKPLKTPPVPQVADAAWARDDLDRFVLSKLEASQLKPNPDADSYALIRRVSLDLTGLPPTVEEIEAFVKSYSRTPTASHSRASSAGDKAYEALLDRYLASPRFGERWGRHWLDVVRYADSVGRSWNAPFTYAWRYRDYVIDAFNRDTPYDRFIAEQLAGDLLPPHQDLELRRAQLMALGFLGMGNMELRAPSNEGFVMDQVDDQIDVTTRAFLGLTVSCARCHDHKYDPVSMRDYYALAGVFYSTETLTGQGHQGGDGRGGYVDAELLVGLPNAKSAKARVVSLNGASDGGSEVHSMNDFQTLWRQGDRKIRYTTDPDLAMGAKEGEIRDCELRTRGEPHEREEAPPRGDLRIPGLPRLPRIPSHVSGRLELARWIGSKSNPLTARVMVNRVWQHLFGRGLVRTVDDFGSTGEEPTHPEMLDHLAVRFASEGWSVKKLIRTIMFSRTYRLSSQGNAANEAIDPQNLMYWRMNLRRLELEPIRDSLLLAAGRLKFERPEGIQVAGMGGKSGPAASHSLLDVEDPYRTVYLPVLRSLLPELYGIFDFPDPTQIKGERDVTTVAPQALVLMNSSFVADCAHDAAERLLSAPGLDDVGRVKAAYLGLCSRQPTAPEIKAAGEFMLSLEPPSDEREPVVYRWSTFVQALMASAEFRYVR